MDEIQGQVRTDYAVSHLQAARHELMRLGYDKAAERVRELMDQLDHGLIEEED